MSAVASGHAGRILDRAVLIPPGIPPPGVQVQPAQPFPPPSLPALQLLGPQLAAIPAAQPTQQQHGGPLGQPPSVGPGSLVVALT